VWLGFFLHGVLGRFADLAERWESAAVGERYRQHAAELSRALEGMWRGDRYVRATTDAGEELANFDALMAAWPVISGAVGLERGLEAMEAALGALEKDDLVVLLTPALTDASRPFPGRIATYPPGVRENGGQYTHGVSWLVDAFVRLAGEASALGEVELALRLRARAFEIWCKISPLGKTEGERLVAYGLVPHQQPPDIYWGPGYEGRGGWSWYTGSAARMLESAYVLLGLAMRDGELVVPDDLFEPKGTLRVRRLVHEGRAYVPPSAAEPAARAVEPPV
jgi:cyclic beta-1,2-glucan synthetase